MAQKKGITSLKDAIELREDAIEMSKLVKREFKDLIPHRIDQNTFILVDPKKDVPEQINRFTNKLSNDRKNYD